MNKLLASFKRHWFIYIISVFLAITLPIWIISLVIEPKTHEKYGLMIDGYDISLTKEDLFFSTNIRKVSIKNVNPTDLGIFIAAQKEAKDYDTLIIRKETFNHHDYTYALISLDEETLNTLIPHHSPEYVIKDGLKYGFNVTDHVAKFAKNELNDQYYLCFFKNSIHSGLLNHQNYSESLYFANWLISQ